MQRIIYKKDDGGVAIIIPTAEWLETHTIEELAEKDVPAGAEFKIVNVTDIPEDRTFRDAWEYVARLLLTLIKPKRLLRHGYVKNVRHYCKNKMLHFNEH